MEWINVAASVFVCVNRVATVWEFLGGLGERRKLLNYEKSGGGMGRDSVQWESASILKRSWLTAREFSID